MDPLPFEMFCSKHSDCEAPISVITEILSENDPIKFVNISNEFEALGFTKIKDLAKTTIEKARSIKLRGDSLKLLYKALEMYDKHLDDLQTSAKLEIKNGNFIRAQQICKELLTQKPHDINVIHVMAESFFKCEDYNRSISYLIFAYVLNPDSYITSINMAMNYLKLSKYDLANYFLMESIRTSARFNKAWMYYADVLVLTNKVVMANNTFNTILKVFPNSYTTRNKYGKFLLQQKKIKNAKYQFKIALKSGENCETLSNLGDVYFMTDKCEKAIFYYQKALEINPNMNITLFNLGKVYSKINEHQKATEAYEKSIKLDSANFSVLKNLAISYSIQKNVLKSVETFQECLKLQPDDFDINYELAMINYHNLTNYQEAENYFKKCIQLDSQREELYRYLYQVLIHLKKRIDASNICMTMGDIHFKNSDLENAKNAFYTALCANPENVDGHWKLGLTMHKLGHFDSAILRYKKADELKRKFAHP